MSKTVVHCINSFSSLAGGVGFALQSLCNHVTGVKHIIFALRDSEPSLNVINAESRFFNRTGPFVMSYSRSLERDLETFLVDNRDAIVHVHGLWSGLSFSVNRIRKRERHVKYVISPHGMLSAEAMKRRPVIKSVMRILWENSFLANATGIHCLTKAEEAIVKGFSAGVRTFVQPHSIRFPFSESALRESWNTRRRSQKTLLYLGRIHETKGVVQLVEELSHRHGTTSQVNFRLKIAGIGNPATIDALNGLIRASHAEIEFLGPVFGDAKQKLMQSAHAIILPSMTEGLPMTLLEGAANGLPLLITRECNLDWVEAERAGKNVPYGPAGTGELVGFFEQASMDMLEEMGQRSMRQASQRYSDVHAAEMWREIYESL